MIYHSCGNVKKVYEDFIDIGIDAHNPIEAKAGLDVVELRQQHGHKIGFCGNMNVMDWAACDNEELKKIVLLTGFQLEHNLHKLLQDCV